MRQKNAIVDVWRMFAVFCVIGLTQAWAQPTYQSVFGKAQILRSTVGPDGSIYVAGTTRSPDFPVTEGALQKTITQSICYYSPGPPVFPVPCDHGFIAKIDPEGRRLVFATYLSGQRGSIIFAIAVDSEGFIYVGGDATEGFPFTLGTPQSPRWGGFIAKLVPDGSALVYAARVPGSASGIAVTRSITFTSAEERRTPNTSRRPGRSKRGRLPGCTKDSC